MKIQYIIAIHLMRWLTKFYDFRFKWTATAAIGIHPTKTWLSQLLNFKNATWTWRHFRRTICNKNCVLNLEKMPQKCMECFRLPFDHLAWIEHQFVRGIRDSRKAGSLWGMMRGVGEVSKLEHHSLLAKGLGLGLLCWGFKGVQTGLADNMEQGKIPWYSHRLMHRKRVTCELHDSYFRLMKIKHAIPKILSGRLNYYINRWRQGVSEFEDPLVTRCGRES